MTTTALTPQQRFEDKVKDRLRDSLTLIAVSREVDNLHSILSSMAIRYMDAVCTGRTEQWAEAMHAIIDCFRTNKFRGDE